MEVTSTVKKILYASWIIGNIFILGLTLVITRVLVKPKASWGWFVSILVILIIIDVIIGIILIFKYLKKIKIPEAKQDPKEARDRAILEKKLEVENPDNFIIKNQRIVMVGESGKARTPILHLSGKGYEKKSRLDCLIDLSKEKFCATWLQNSTDEKVREATIRMAENPETEITEERVTSLDDFGRPTTKIVSKKISQAEREQIEQKEKAEELNKI